MTFEECKEKYPVGSTRGNFSFGRPCSIKMVNYYLRSRSDYSNLFFVKTNDGEYYGVDPWLSECEGYVTVDGIHFSAYFLNEEGQMYDFDDTNVHFFFKGDYSRQNIIEKFRERYPDYKIIDSVLDLNCEF